MLSCYCDNMIVDDPAVCLFDDTGQDEVAKNISGDGNGGADDVHPSPTLKT